MPKSENSSANGNDPQFGVVVFVGLLVYFRIILSFGRKIEGMSNIFR